MATPSNPSAKPPSGVPAASEHRIAACAIGNELLSGKVSDSNIGLLIREFRAVGTSVHEVRWVADDVEAIGVAVAELSARFDAVITSGGIGPTHDDVTYAGVASAFSESRTQNARLEAALSTFYGSRINPQLLRMADLPASAELLDDPRLEIPLVRVRNVYILPGEPTVFAKKLAAIRDRFRSTQIVVARVFTRLGEGELAELLAETEQRFAVAVGSYPRYDRSAYAVLVTLEAKDFQAVSEALAFVKGRLPRGAIVRVDEPAVVC